MTELDLIIGGRSFVIACEEAEQEKVKEAAELINSEAEEIQDQLGRLPESKMLLLSALMIADRAVDVEVEIKALKKNIENLESSLKAIKKGEDQNTVEKIKSLKMESLVEKMLANLEAFANQASIPANLKENEAISEPNDVDKNQPKLF